MALILCIDTAIDKATICFSKDGEVLCSAVNENQKEHASFVQVAIKNLCTQYNIELKAIDAVAVTDGPGSYTGLRVGMASAKGLCYALNKPLITMSTLELLASSAIDSSTILKANPTALICPMIDARRMEVFTAIYDKNLAPILPPTPLVITENYFIKLLEKQPILYVGNGAFKINVLYKHFNVLNDIVAISSTILAKSAEQSFVNQYFTNIVYSQPNYLKAFVDGSNKKNI
jgi:tRNA threonylcarbamoyladenosine biosynthesis protein TsaB